MTKTEEYVLGCLKKWVWSGYYTVSRMEAMLADVVDSGCDLAWLRASIRAEQERKLKAEAEWGETTDCDRLDDAFNDLHEQGICALENTGYEMSDGYPAVAEAVATAPAGRYHGYCFFHGQDVERALAGHGIMIAFGALNDDPVLGARVGRTVAAGLRSAGFLVEWDGSVKNRIAVPTFRWERRSQSDANYEA